MILPSGLLISLLVNTALSLGTPTIQNQNRQQNINISNLANLLNDAVAFQICSIAAEFFRAANLLGANITIPDCDNLNMIGPVYSLTNAPVVTDDSDSRNAGVSSTIDNGVNTPTKIATVTAASSNLQITSTSYGMKLIIPTTTSSASTITASSQVVLTSYNLNLVLPTDTDTTFATTFTAPGLTVVEEYFVSHFTRGEVTLTTGPTPI